MQYIVLFYYSAFSLLTKKTMEYAGKADTKKFTGIVLAPTFIVALTYGIFTFLCVYAAQAPMSQLVNAMPGWLSHGFEIAGGILPAVGFTAACFIKFGNLMPVAVIGIALAMIEFERAKKDRDTNEKLREIEQNANSGGDNDGI